MVKNQKEGSRRTARWQKNKKKACGTLLDGKKSKRRLAAHFQMVKNQKEGLRHTSRW